MNLITVSMIALFVSLTKYHFFLPTRTGNLQPLRCFGHLWMAVHLLLENLLPATNVITKKKNTQKMSMPGARYMWVKYVLPQYISSRVQNPLATIGPHQNWHLDQCWIKSCWTWYDCFKTLLKFPSAKSVSGKSGNIGGKSEKLSTLPRDLRFVAISHPPPKIH